MKKIFLLICISGIFLFMNFSLAFAKTVQEEEKEGKAIWDGLLNKSLTCNGLSDNQFELMGEYFMGTMAGSSHKNMNQMMKQMMGEAGEEQTHIIMGKRTSGCDVNATANISSDMMQGMMPMMMNMMGGGMIGGSNPIQTNVMQGIMGNWGYYGYWTFLNVLYVILLIGMIILVYSWVIKLWKNMQNKGGKK